MLDPAVGVRNLVDVWSECVRRFPRKAAVRAPGVELAYAQVDGRARALAAALASRFGVRPGDRVAVLMQNRPEYLVAYWATHLAGATVAAISPRLSRREADYVVRTAAPAVLLTDGSAEALAKGAAVPAVVGLEEIRALGSGGPAAELPPPPTGPEDLAVLAHTSGTTGEPKIAEVTHANLLFNLRLAIFAHSLRHEDVILVGVPMFHCTPLYSLMPSAAYLGATLVITAETSAAAQASSGAAAGASVWFGVPTLFHQLAASPEDLDARMAGLRLLAYAGSPMRPETIRRLHARWPELALHNFFGLTETISMTHVLPAADALERADSVGKVLPEVYVRIVGEDGREVSRGAVGELCFHRRNVIRGYLGKPGLLDRSFAGDWFRTGDLALEDPDGYLYLRGRSKDMIIVAGENVYAAEVEGVLARCPGVDDVAVVGVRAEGVRASLGELVKAVVVRASGAQFGELEVKRFAAGELASYKVPHIVEFREALPRNPTGKVIKDQLR
jgi:acyl-CoA synthetase (AMP-forming)/AMP-acid ligase II